MGKLFKIIFGIIASLIGLIVVAAIAIPLLVDPNDFRGEITDAVTDATGRSMKIEGDLSLSVFPWLGINTGAVELGNAKGFGKQSFAKIDSTQIRVRLLPLLSKKIEMDTLVLTGLELNLQKNKKGHDNWSDLAGNKKASTKETSSDTPQLAALAIGGIQLDNARIQLKDAANGKSFSLSSLNLNTGAITSGQTVSVSLTGLLENNKPAIKTNISLNTSLALNLNEQSLTLNKLALELGDLSLNGNVSLSKLLSKNPGIKGKIKLASFNPRKVLGQFGIKLPVTADANALQRMSLDSLINGNLNKLQLNDLQLVLDDTLINGQINLALGKRTSISHKINLDQIDLDRYMPPVETKQTRLGFINTAHAASTAQLIPTDLLRSFDIKGSVSGGAITVNRMLAENVKLSIALKNGDLRLNPISASLYGGQYKGNIHIDARRTQGNRPLLSVNESLNNVQLGPVTKAMYDKDLIVGEGNVSAKLTARGQSILAMKKSLNGEIRLLLNKGALKGINVSQVIRETYATYKGKSTPAPTGENETAFSKMSVSFQAKNGVLNSQDLIIESQLPRIKGKGTIDIVTNRINYQLKTKVDDRIAQQLDLKEEYIGIPLRVNITGNLLKPSYKIDWLRAVGRIIEKQQKKKLLDSLLGKKKKETAPTAPSTSYRPNTAPSSAPVVTKTPEQLKREEKKRKQEEKKKLLKKLLGF